MVNYPADYDNDETLFHVTDLAKTRLTQTINDTQTSIPVESTTCFPEKGIIRIGDELIKYTSKTATTFENCERGYGGTTATAHSQNELVWLPILGEHHNKLKDAIIQIEKFVGLRPNDWSANDTVVEKIRSLEVSNSDVSNHINNFNNPHHVTLEQARSEDNKVNGPIDFNNNEAKNLVLEKVTTLSNGVEGKIAYKQDENVVVVYDGFEWKKVAYEDELKQLQTTISNLKLKDLSDVPEYEEGKVLGVVNNKPEWVSIAAATGQGRVLVSPTDDTPNFLDEKLVVDVFLNKEIVSQNNNEKLKLGVKVNDNQATETNLWSAAKVKNELDQKAPLNHTHNIFNIENFPSIKGNAGKFLAVKDDESGLEWKTINVTGSDGKVKVDENDTPGYLIEKVDNTTITIQNKKLHVKDNVFAPVNHTHQWSDIDKTGSKLSDLGDVPEYENGKVLVVKDDGNGIEYEDTFILDGGVI